ncbi:hypothetical protein CsSME_00043432 [Camellia sinensis var. sinensis]
MLSLMFARLTRCYSCCFATLGAVGAAVYWCCLLLPWVLNTGASSCGKEFDGVLFGSCWKILQGKEVAELDGCACGVVGLFFTVFLFVSLFWIGFSPICEFSATI